jgi:putative CocE/NonD family hydrolase
VKARKVLTLLVASALLGWPAAASASRRANWTPEAPTYAITEAHNVPVTMPDGTVLRANVYWPANPHTGRRASGRFPVVMVQTPYGKDTVGAASGQSGGAEAATETAEVPYLIERGYIDVVAEVRGTGDSGGTFGLLDPIQGADGATLVRWAARLPGSNGRVGLYGPSYMGLDQFMTAAHLGPHSPLKALFSIVAGNDTYRDIAFDGGLLDAEFDTAALTTIFGPLEEANPIAESSGPLNLLSVELQHAGALTSYNATQALSIGLGGSQAYDGAYWQARAPRNMLARVVADHIPAFMVGGWFDLYQRGGILNYTGLQNLWDHRPVGAPMLGHQPVTGRYQLLYGPWYHLTAGSGYDIYALELRWFDRWLKGEPTGIDRTRTPLHIYQLESNRWMNASRWPLPQAKATTLYLGPRGGSGAPSVNDGSLTSFSPRVPSASDTTFYSTVSNPCGRSLEQWGAGAGALAFETGDLPPDPCTTDDRGFESSPGALTYTTAPLSHPMLLAGPIDATIFATSTRPDVELVATIEDVLPGGRAAPLTSGALLGSFRALDPRLSWYGADGRLIAPYHPFTKASAEPVPVGKVVRYDIEIFPTTAWLAAGDRLRLTLTTSDIPHLLASPRQAANLAGGVYRIERSRAYASYLEVPLVSER